MVAVNDREEGAKACARVRCAVLLACTALLGPTFPLPARASGHSATPADQARAATLKKRAGAEMDSLHYADALQDYRDAWDITHEPALLYNEARVLQALQNFPEAVAQLDRFMQQASPELKARVPQLGDLHAELAKHIAKLTVHCSVPDARIIVSGKVEGLTPRTEPLTVNAGSALLEVVADGYVSFQRQINLPAGGALVVEAPLSARDAKGELRIASIPDESDVLVDGKPIGRTPMEVRVSPGSHNLRVMHAGFRDAMRSTLVVEDETKEVTVTLHEKHAITEEWWFWAGVTVIGAAAVATVVSVALSTDKPAGHGTIPPGQVSGLGFRFP